MAIDKGNWLDRFIASFAPQWGLRRVRARLAARHYDAAGVGRRTQNWHRYATDVNAAALPSLISLRELSRDLRRNNGWARRGIRVISVNTVGWGIAAQPVGARERRLTDAMDRCREWAGSTKCDYDGRLPFTGLQRLVMETVVESGEAIVVRERAQSSDGLALPLRGREIGRAH